MQDVESQGHKGEVKNVSEGYARNYLFPRQLAVPATPEVLKQLEAGRLAEEKRERQARSQAEELAAQLNSATVTVTVKVGDAGRVFGAVTNKQIAEGLEGIGYRIDKKKIALPEPVRSLGDITVPIRLHHEVTAHVKVKVVAAP